MRAFVRTTPLTNLKGRQTYIFDEKRQEDIVLKFNEDIDFTPYVNFEKTIEKDSSKKNREGRELIFKLPSDWSDLSKRELEENCKEIAENAIQKNTDYCFAVHWNKDKTNLHMHVVFSERERSYKYKIYKKDVWLKKDGTLAKSKNERHTLLHKKGDLKKDKNGDLVVETQAFTAKNPIYKQKNYCANIKNWYENYLKSKNVYIAQTWINQRHMGKGLPPEKEKFVLKYNDLAFKINNAFDDLERVSSIRIGDGIMKNLENIYEQKSVDKGYIYSFEGLKSIEKLISEIKVARTLKNPDAKDYKDRYSLQIDKNNLINLLMQYEVPQKYLNDSRGMHEPERRPSARDKLREKQEIVKNTPRKKKNVDRELER